MFDIAAFSSNIVKKGVLRNNKYDINFVPPTYLTTNKSQIYTHGIGGAGNSELNRMISLRCENVNLPGVNLASADGPPRYGYGPTQKNPYGVMFNEMSITFMIDKDGDIHKFFYEWLNTIVNFNGHGGARLRDSIGPVGKMKTYEVGYKDSFSTDIKINVYNDDASTSDLKTLHKVMTVTAYRAFPMSLPTLPVSWNDGEVMILTIPFAYTDFAIDYYSTDNYLA